MFLALLSTAFAVAALCWLLYTLALYALPVFVGAGAAAWAYETGAGLLGAGIVGLVAGAAALGIGMLLFALARPLWARLAVAILFVAPAALAGYHATHGLVQHTTPSDLWQTLFSIVGAVAVGGTAFVRLAGLTFTQATGRGPAEA